MTLMTFFLLAFAIEHITDIWTNVDALEGIRAFFCSVFQGFEKLTWCRFCQSFWLSGLAAFSFEHGLFAWKGDFAGFVDVLLTWIILHKVVLLIMEAFDRYLNRAPISANILLHKANEPESGP